MDEKMTRLIGNQLREARKMAGKTQKELALAVSSTAASISKWEKGLRGIPAPMLYKITTALNVDINRINIFPPHPDSFIKEEDFCGNIKFNMEKFKCMILFFADGGETQANIRKLLFLADVLHYKKMNKISLSGAMYRKDIDNVIPKEVSELGERELDTVFQSLLQEGRLGHRELCQDNEIIKQVFTVSYDFRIRLENSGFFLEGEMSILKLVSRFAEKLKKQTGKNKEFSHYMSDYLERIPIDNYHRISYELAAASLLLEGEGQLLNS